MLPEAWAAISEALRRSELFLSSKQIHNSLNEGNSLLQLSEPLLCPGLGLLLSSLNRCYHHLYFFEFLSP